MIATQKEPARLDSATSRPMSDEIVHEKWMHCHVNWTAVWVGALATLGMIVLFGLIAVALGVQLFGPEHRVVDFRRISIGILIFSVCGAFFSSVVGGWVAGRIAGILHSEPAMIHGAIVWLLTVPLLLAAAGTGAASLLGGWYGGLGANPATAAVAPFAHPEPLIANATPEETATFKAQLVEYNRNVAQWREDTPRVVRNSALGATIALLLGLVGCVIGAWISCGEPMNFTHYRTRKPRYHIG